MTAPIFRNPDLQRQFDEDGFVQIQLMLPEDIAALREMYGQFFPESPQAFHSSSYLSDFEKKKEISDAIVAVLSPRIAEIFQDYTVFGSAFLTKNTGKSGQMPMHQDWTIVDEKEAIAVNIWTPLQAADAVNGSLQVLKGSHAFLPVLRAPSLPFFYESYQEAIQENLTLLEVQAGEAVVLNQATIHASPPNMSEEVRLAITTGLKTAGAPMRFHYETEPGKLEVFAMEDDFLLRFEDFHADIFQRPKFGESLGLIDFVQENPGPEAILKMINAAGGVEKNAVAVTAPDEAEPNPSPKPRAKSFWTRLFGA